MNPTNATRFQALTSLIVMLGLVYAMGVCAGGCIEENQWYAMLHHAFEHDHDLPDCAAEHKGHSCDCDQPEKQSLVDSSRPTVTSLEPAFGELFTFAPVAVVALVVEFGVTQDWSSMRPPSTRALTLRAHLQLFRC